MKIKKQRPIPDELLIKVIDEIHDLKLFVNSKNEAKCVDTWGEEECTFCRRMLGPEYQYVESDYIKIRACNLRKHYKLKGSGKSKRKPRYKPSPDYQKYLDSEHWQAFRERVLKFWGYTCCVCMSRKRLDVHHRTYERRGAEELTDCVALCRDCHNRVHGSMPNPDDKKLERMLF